MPNAPEPSTTGAELKRRLKMSSRTLTRWLNEYGLKCKRDKGGRNPKINLWDVVILLYARSMSAAEGDGDAIGAARIKLLEARVAKAERENEEATRLLVRREAAMETMDALLGPIRTALDTLGKAYPQLQPEIERVISEAVSFREKIEVADDVA